MSGKTRRYAFLTALSLVALVPVVSSPAYAQKSATQINVKVGYVNLAMIKANTPDSASSEELTHKAEAFLKASVEESNKRLLKAQEEKKSEEEIKKLKSDLQTQINAKQQAYAELVQSSQAQSLQRISAAVNQVASDKGLDLVVDGGGVLAGGQKLLDNGVDITNDVVKKLAPNAAAAAPAATSTASAPAATPAKQATK
ncbi:MAG: OmpH family outer membrane protein [Cyanobacteria bacterium SZAS LIN-2]|nr:OmpH family outer membrane protein [Cyanobacteria bacterium SZAS LIN-2]